MGEGISRRTFLEGAAAGTASLSMFGALTERSAAETILPAPGKVRVGKVYFGHTHPGWPMDTVNPSSTVHCM